MKSRTKSEVRVSRDSSLFQTILKAIHDKKGENVVSLDLRKIDEAVADFFILCEAQSHIQINSIASNIEEEVRLQCDEKPYHVENGQLWTLVDYVNIVVHVFQRDERKFYDLEGLWMDAEKMEHPAS
ncbi:ribosome silencing factor [Taibaiella lutea]|uniref:Ribosomal silencing factor RsfS n=1 Tax=Taibaiella lutea TaxID=2608001 RepID=A0A5M6CJE2_9BACT|nr:ribosome silencing factor [Taibaiella lutea]